MPSKRKTVEAAAEANAHSDAPAGNTPANSDPRFASASNLNDNSTPDLGPDTTSPVEPVRSKRQRVSRACDQCRAAREKCDGIQPACFPCVSQGRSCTYQANPKKRGVQTGYIRTLELALAWMFENVATGEDALHNLLVHESGRGGALLVGKDSPAAERLHAKWGRSRVNKTITRLLSGQTAQDPSDDGPSPSQGLSVEKAGQSIPDPSHAPESSFSAPATVQTHTRSGPFLPLISANDSETSFQPDGGTQPPSTGIGKLPPNHWRLLDIYFSYTHSWLPILEKKDMYQALYQYSEQGLLLPSANVESGVHAELWSALALASFQAAATAAAWVSGSPAPAVYGGVSDISPSPTDLYDTARKLIPSENGPFQVQHCRALLLLCLVHLGRDDWESAWLLVGFAVRVLLIVRTQSLPDNDQLRPRMRALQVACFILDTIVSIQRNVPAHLKPEDVADLPLPEDGQDQWEPWTPCEGLGGEHTMLQMLRNPAYPLSTFNHLYRVTKLVALELLPRMQMSSQHSSLEFRSRLQQVISHNSPFGVFILSQDTASAFVPTAYLTRAFYLWAAAFSEPVNDHFSRLLIETLDQYQKRFGTYAVPPLVLTLLASLIAAKEQSHCADQHRRQLKEVLPAYCLIWSRVGRKSDNNFQPIRRYEPPSTAIPNANANLEQPLATSISQANGRYIGLPNSTPYNDNTVPDTVVQTDGPRHYGSINARGILNAYPPPTTHLVEAAMALTHGGAPPRPPLPPQPPQTAAAYVDTTMNDPPNSHNIVPMAHFGYSTVDYDAMVDDLASIEYTDAVDVDPQFMTNLGFVPGCNFSDINAYEK
ncbi:quinic acid activator [Sordaria brevicollis]|uniref:Quinic acid activator n=1 Tax=Sordaria brevicollis TaxID=83679 RepID=A0AAE0P1K3_SORBR|nr:quinic acid activator [Sordaria brevicollis]